MPRGGGGVSIHVAEGSAGVNVELTGMAGTCAIRPTPQMLFAHITVHAICVSCTVMCLSLHPIAQSLQQTTRSLASSATSTRAIPATKRFIRRGVNSSLGRGTLVVEFQSARLLAARRNGRHRVRAPSSLAHQVTELQGRKTVAGRQGQLSNRSARPHRFRSRLIPRDRCCSSLGNGGLLTCTVTEEEKSDERQT